jgi:uncharacterized membrane protein YeaQ/YmgE (transglycosylase-associated protein family)
MCAIYDKTVMNKQLLLITHSIYYMAYTTSPQTHAGRFQDVLLWIVFGGLAGWIASIIVGQNAQYGLVGNIAVGIIGAFLGGWIADRVGFGGQPGAERPTSVYSFITAVFGAIILLLLLNLVF